MTEVEIKAALTAEQYEDILSGAPPHGYKFICELQERDVYMNGIDRNFMKTDEALRVRRTNNVTLEKKSGYITYKGPKQDDVSMTRREIEVQVRDADAALEVLELLGFHSVLHVIKKRRLYTNGGISLYLDHVESLGYFLELEQMVETGQNYDAALACLFESLRRLNIPESSLERRSYLELLIQKQSES